MLYALLVFAAAVVFRVIHGPFVSFVDQMPGAGGRNNLFRVRIRRGSYQAAVLAQELWESDRTLLRAIPGYKRGAQIFSHEIEVQAAGMHYGADVEAYRHAEARRMGSYPELKGLSAAEIEVRMRAKADDAFSWVHKHRTKLARHR